MNRFILVFAACLLCASGSFAQQSAADAPASKEEIRRYLDMLHTRDRMNELRDANTKSIYQMIHQMAQKLPGLPGDFEQSMQKMADEMLSDVSVDKMMEALEPVYEKHFTKGEMDALFAFYATPMGQKILKELPSITADASKAVSGLLQTMTTKMVGRLQEEAARVQKEEEATPTKPNPPTQN